MGKLSEVCDKKPKVLRSKKHVVGGKIKYDDKNKTPSLEHAALPKLEVAVPEPEVTAVEPTVPKKSRYRKKKNDTPKE